MVGNPAASVLCMAATMSLLLGVSSPVLVVSVLLSHSDSSAADSQAAASAPLLVPCGSWAASSSNCYCSPCCATGDP